MNFIKLHQANSESEIYVNHTKICDIFRSKQRTSTMITYDNEEHYIEVKETPEEILKKISPIGVLPE